MSSQRSARQRETAVTAVDEPSAPAVVSGGKPGRGRRKQQVPTPQVDDTTPESGNNNESLNAGDVNELSQEEQSLNANDAVLDDGEFVRKSKRIRSSVTATVNYSVEGDAEDEEGLDYEEDDGGELTDLNLDDAAEHGIKSDSAELNDEEMEPEEIDEPSAAANEEETDKLDPNPDADEENVEEEAEASATDESDYPSAVKQETAASNMDLSSSRRPRRAAALSAASQKPPSTTAQQQQAKSAFTATGKAKAKPSQQPKAKYPKRQARQFSEYDDDRYDEDEDEADQLSYQEDEEDHHHRSSRQPQQQQRRRKQRDDETGDTAADDFTCQSCHKRVHQTKSHIVNHHHHNNPFYGHFAIYARANLPSYDAMLFRSHAAPRSDPSAQHQIVAASRYTNWYPIETVSRKPTTLAIPVEQVHLCDNCSILFEKVRMKCDSCAYVPQLDERMFRDCTKCFSGIISKC